MRQLQRKTLDNGLRVVLAPDWPTPRMAVSVHYGVGFRSELPGQEGLAHLFEHLMFRGSESLPDGDYFTGLIREGGTANGTTHQDYTDYVQTAPAQALEQALFREADRMRAPLFTEKQLKEQLDGVEQEITLHREARPFGGCPWPLLPRALFHNFAHTHDGYGNLAQLRRTTVEDCAGFFDQHYAPGNAVLTIVTPHSPEEVWPLIQRHFGDISARPAPPASRAPEPPLTKDRTLTCTEPGTDRTAVAVGYRLPDPRADLPGYLPHMVLAELVRRTADRATSGFPAPISTACGFFGPLDALHPDALVLTSLLPPGTSVADFTEPLTTMWSRYAEPTSLAAETAEATLYLAAHHRRLHADLLQRCRSLGRLELLFDRAELADELPDMLEQVTPDRVAAAAAGYSTAHRAILVMAPGRQRTRPAPAKAPTAPAAASSRRAAELGRTPGGPRREPPLGRGVTAAIGQAHESQLASGLRILSLPDLRTNLVELRLRIPLGIAGWRQPQTAARLLHTAATATHASARAAQLGGELRLYTEGQWADVTCWGPYQEHAKLLRILADLLDPNLRPAQLLPGGEHLLSRAPDHLMDQALRLHWTEQPRQNGTTTDPARLHQLMLTPHDALLVAVGGKEPEPVVEEAHTVLERRAAHRTDLTPPIPTLASQAPAAGVITLGRSLGGNLRLTLSGREAMGESCEAARYLAVALLGGHAGSRLADWYGRMLPAEYDIFAGRDILADQPRAMVRATVSRQEMAEAVAGVCEQVNGLAAREPGHAELEAARRYCNAQLASAFDSPGMLADALRHTVAAGRGLDWVMHRHELLQTVSREDVSAAARDVFASLAAPHLVLGDTGDRTVARELGIPPDNGEETTDPRAGSRQVEAAS